MANYLHGAYGNVNVAGSKSAAESRSAFVYIGTAPVHLVHGGADNVNKPVVVNNIGEARAKFGYSNDFAKYTLCEAMKAHLIDNGVGPIVLINVLDPVTHVNAQKGSATLTPANGRVTIVNAETVCIDTITVKAGGSAKEYGTDYTVSYNENAKTMTITEATAGALGTAALTIEWTNVDASKVDSTAVIGSTDGMGLNKGIYAVRSVYQATGLVPSFMLCPGFSSIPDVHKAMVQNSHKINAHWDAYLLCDLPLVNGSSEKLTLATAAAWKTANGYTNENETVYFPMIKGTDGLNYHISVLAAANLQNLLVDQDGVPYRTPSNTEIAIAQGLYLGEDEEDRFYDDEIINEHLNKNGIASACYIGGRWAIWGAHSASYSEENGDAVNVSETARMMLYYISNDFQVRRTADVDAPMTANDLKSIVSEEQERLDALTKIGALTYAEVMLDASMMSESDIANGDYRFAFSITTTPIAKSLTAVVTWTDAGFTTYYEAMNA